MPPHGLLTGAPQMFRRRKPSATPGLGTTEGSDTRAQFRRKLRRTTLYARYIARRIRQTWRYRIRLQRDEYPDPQDSLRLVDHPSPIFQREQLAVGRILGRGYLWFDRQRERVRIQRSRIGDRLGGPRLTLILIRQQVGLLLIVLTLIVVGFAADIITTRYGPDLRTLPGGHFAAHHLTGPSPATLTSVLAATATATGAVLGLVLTISLITFQTTASRYRSDRIVAFLVREQVGSVVVRLLAAGFLFSLWLLLLRNLLTGHPPYVSTALAVAITTAGIGSLIVYRLHALLGLAPANVFVALEREIRQELSRLTRKRPGRSVEAHAQRTCEDDLQITKDLLATLARGQDWRGAAAGIAMLSRLIDSYVPFKRRLPGRSQWFRPIPVRLGSEAYSITLHLARLGRLPPTDMRPEHDWFEREIYDAVALVPADGLSELALRDSLFLLHGHAIQLAWRAQEFEVLDRALSAADSLATTPEITAAASQGFLELPWVAVNEFAQGLSPSVEAIIETQPWERENGQRLPRAARELADDLGRKIRKEIAITGAVVTPEREMIAELRPRWEQLSTEKQSLYLARGFALATKHLHAVVEAGVANQAAIAAEVTLRIIVLAFAAGAKPVVEVNPLRRDLVDAYRLAEPTARTQLREEGVWVALRTLAEHGELNLACDLLEAAFAMELFEDVPPNVPGPSPLADRSGSNSTIPTSADTASAQRRFELMLQFAYVYGWAEYRQVSVLERVAPLVSGLFDLEALLPLLDTGASILTWPFASGVKHRTWFQPLTMAIHELPQVPVLEPGAIGYGLAREHPSPWIRDWADYGDIDDVVKAMVEQVVRFNVHARLMQLFEQRIKTLGG